MSREDDITREVPVLGIDGRPLETGGIFGKAPTAAERERVGHRLGAFNTALSELRAKLVHVSNALDKAHGGLRLDLQAEVRAWREAIDAIERLARRERASLEGGMAR